MWAGYSYDYGPANTGCLSGQNDFALSREAMKACDDGMALLAGPSTSVGMVGRLAKTVNEDKENARDRMPVKCCLDTPSDSEYFGYNVSWAFSLDVVKLFLYT